MSDAPIPSGLRQTLLDARKLLLPLHKLLLDTQRAAYERENGAVGSPGQFLQIVLGDPGFEWLRRLSGFIVEIDEALAPRSKAGLAEAEALVAQARTLLQLREDGDEFQRNYYAALQDSPEIVIAHCKLEKLLGL